MNILLNEMDLIFCHNRRRLFYILNLVGYPHSPRGGIELSAYPDDKSGHSMEHNQCLKHRKTFNILMHRTALLCLVNAR